jgi:GNAT superfamily N-acetyltransferase
MIRFALESDTAAVRELWSIAFSGEEEFDEYYFDNVYRSEYTLIYECEGKIVAMLQRLPYTLSGYGRVTYIYGAATSPEYRCKGIMGELLEYSAKLDRGENISASVLIPANANLFGYYARHAYYSAFTLGKERRIIAERVAGEELIELKEAESYSVLEKYSRVAVPHIERDISYIMRQMDMYKRLGGFCYEFKGGYCFGSVDTELIIDELVCEESDRAAVVNVLLKRLDRTQAQVKYIGGDVQFGMLRAHRDEMNEPKGLYMNMMYN